MPYLLSLHFKNMWEPTTFVHGLPMLEFPNRRSAQLVYALMHIMPIPIFILAGLGLVATLRRWKQLLLVYLVILMTIAENVVFYGSMRFRSPIEPLLVLLTGGAIWWLTSKDPGTLRSLFKKSEVREETPVQEEPESASAL
jgi:hypothetical protein